MLVVFRDLGQQGYDLRLVERVQHLQATVAGRFERLSQFADVRYEWHALGNDGQQFLVFSMVA